MKNQIIHQMLHGYRGGHRQLASSIKLDARTSDLITRLSDLSGSLSSNDEISSYLTCYPLRKTGFYALAKTWLDINASRTGCVLTHTLLISSSDWANSPSPQRYSQLFGSPLLDNEFNKYGQPIEFSPSLSPLEKDSLSFIQEGWEFVYKYFGEGLKPILWLGASNPEKIMWQIINALWPNIRSQFACCTLALQPRSFDQKPFDVLFSSKANYSRFHKIPRENVIGERSRELFTNKQNEPWINDWSEYIFGGKGGDTLLYTTSILAKRLEEDPTSIKSFFLARELYLRASTSATAAIGLIDMVDTLVPGGDDEVAFKESIFNMALKGIGVSDSVTQAAEYYFLLDQRLTRTAFANINEQISKRISLKISELVILDLEAVLSASRRFISSTPERLYPAVSIGMITGLSKLANTSTSSLTILRQYPDVAQFGFAADPFIALGCLLNSQQANLSGILISDILDWIRPIENLSTRGRLLKVLLPKVLEYRVISILDELLREFPEGELPEILKLLVAMDNVLADNSVFKIFQERLVTKYSVEIIEWMRGINHWSAGIGKLVSVCFTFDKNGITELLNTFNSWSTRDVAVISMFITRGSYIPLPKWLHEYCDTHPQFIVKILLLDPQTINLYFAPFVNAYVSQTQRLKLSHWVELAPQMDALRDVDFSEKLLDLLIKDAISLFLQEINSQDVWLTWQKGKSVEAWLKNVSSYHLNSFFVPNIINNQLSWGLSWFWLSNVNTSLFKNNAKVLIGLIEILTTRTNYLFDKTIVSQWIKIIQRSTKECDEGTYLKICVQALSFCFANSSYPLSELIVEVFLPVYNAVNNSEYQSETDPLFIFYEWDKCKELRKQLVKSCMESNWPPGDLALAARQEKLIRKIFKRVMRKAKGKEYIEAMIYDLRNRNNEGAISISNYVRGLAKNPNFYEEWD